MSISVFLTFVCHLYPSDNFYTMLLHFCLLQIITEPPLLTWFGASLGKGLPNTFKLKLSSVSLPPEKPRKICPFTLQIHRSPVIFVIFLYISLSLPPVLCPIF
jgi:hypothetical protein